MSAQLEVRSRPAPAPGDATTIQRIKRGRFFIGNAWTAPVQAPLVDLIDPADETIYARVPEASAEDMDRAVAAARAAFDHGPWPQMAPAARAEVLFRIADGIDARADLLADIYTAEVGAIPAHAMAATRGAAQTFRYYAHLGADYPFIDRRPTTAGGEIGLLVREPVGVVAAIVPWNAPLMLIAVKLAPALIAGCTAIMKMSPEAPLEGVVFAEIVEAAGLPAGVVNVLMADRAVSERLVRDPRVDKVSFTGSSAAGRTVASICGQRMARSTLELGGKSAAVILDDYEPQAVVAALVPPMCMMAMQYCAALSRIVVTRKRHDALVDALAAGFEGLRVGHPRDPGTQIGPLSMRRQRDRVEGYIAKGVAEGADLVTGGTRPEGLDRGFYVRPTLFANVDNQSTIAREEIFGPVVSVIPARDEAHAVELANDSDFGLNSAIFTADPDRAFGLARRMRAGTVGINAFRSDFGIAFGGFKQSGIGREGGREGLLPYLETKTIIMDDKPSGLAV